MNEWEVEGAGNREERERERKIDSEKEGWREGERKN